MRYLKIILILFTLKTFGQSDKTFVPGHMCKISIVAIDKKTKDSIPLVLIEGFIKDKRILWGVANLYGELNFKICSNKLPSDTVTFITTAVGYKQDTFRFKLHSDSTIVFAMTLDPLKIMTEEKKRMYENSFIAECGTDQANQLYLDNPTYRHCDGRILTYRQISENHEDFNGWELMENK